MADDDSVQQGGRDNQVRFRDMVAVGVISLAIGVVLCLPALFGLKGGTVVETDPVLNISDTSGGIAATVNGVVIGENAVTSFINNFRLSQGFEEDDAWGTWLVDAGYTIGALRDETVNYYVSRELIRQVARDKGVSVTAEQVDAVLRERVTSAESDGGWPEMLEEADTSEARVRDDVEISLLQQALESKLAEEAPLGDDQLLESVKAYAEAYAGSKRSSHILFEPGEEDAARDLLGRIELGEIDFATAAAQYSKDETSASKGGDVGWDKATQFVQGYQAALDGLSVGEMCGPIETEFGLHLIKCTDELDVQGEVTSIDEVPIGFLDYVREAAEAASAQSAFEDFMVSYKESSEIEVTSLPDDLPYWVDLSPYEEASREAMIGSQQESE